MLHSAGYCKKSSKNHIMKSNRNKDLCFTNVPLKKLRPGSFLSYGTSNIFHGREQKRTEEAIMMFDFYLENFQSLVSTNDLKRIV